MLFRSLEDSSVQLLSGKILVLWDVLHATINSNSQNEVKSTESSSFTPSSLVSYPTNSKQRRTSVGVPRDFYFETLKTLSQGEKLYKPVKTTELKEIFSQIVFEAIETIESYNQRDKEAARNRFIAGAATLSIRKCTINDWVRFNMTSNDIVPEKYNLFILVNENGKPLKFQKNDPVEWRKMYIRPYNKDTDQEYLLNSKNG